MEKLHQGVLTHADQSFVTYVLDGLQNGFRVGFNPASVSLKSTTHNMSSASLQPLVIDDYLHMELAKGLPSHQSFLSHPQKTPARQMALDSGSF